MRPWHKFPRRVNYPCATILDVHMVSITTWFDKYHADYTFEIQDPSNKNIYFLIHLESAYSGHPVIVHEEEWNATIITQNFKKYLRIGHSLTNTFRFEPWPIHSGRGVPMGMPTGKQVKRIVEERFAEIEL